MYYTVTIETEPIGEELWAEAIEHVLDGMAELPEIEGLVGWSNAPSTVGVVFDIDGFEDGAWAAVERGVAAFRSVAKTFFVDPPALRHLEVEPADEVGDEQPALLGATDVAQMLTVSRQRVYQLLEEAPEFPKPVAQTARGQMWNRLEIARWAAARFGGRVPGLTDDELLP